MTLKPALFALLFLSPHLAQAADRPPFVGSYSIPCGDRLQCILEIDQHPEHAKNPLRKDTYLAVWIIADRMNDKDVKCGIPLFMRDIHDGRLISGIAGNVVTVSNGREGGVTVAGVPVARCGLDLTGDYFPIGE